MAYGIARSTFIRALLLGVSTLLGVTASANGQCSAYTSVMAIASNNGGNATLVDVTLSDGGELVFNADTTLGVFAYVQQGPAIKDFSGWYEDANGTATMTNADGDICTIACGSNGVVHISIEGPTFDARSWYVNLSLASSMPGDTCGCSGTSTQTSQCKAEECRLTKKCSKNGYCQAGTLPVKMPAGEPQ